MTERISEALQLVWKLATIFWPVIIIALVATLVLDLHDAKYGK